MICSDIRLPFMSFLQTLLYVSSLIPFFEKCTITGVPVSWFGLLRSGNSKNGGALNILRKYYIYYVIQFYKQHISVYTFMKITSER